jgi:hypothetical protein
MSSQETVYTSPQWGNYRHWAKGLWALGGSIKQRGGQTQSWRKADVAMERCYGQTAAVGAYANQRLNPATLGRPMEERPGLQTGPGKSGCPAL